jgi:hypothetical protein
LVVVDGRARSEFNLMPGQLRMLDALNGFQVKIGNAAGVDAQYDGKTSASWEVATRSSISSFHTGTNLPPRPEGRGPFSRRPKPLE